jgi:protein gp37
MGKTTGISWTDATWNPWQGCTKVSDGCRNCYMYREKSRYGQDPFTVVRSKPATFNAPMKWNLQEGSRIFICSWSDFFHEDADPWRAEAWQIIDQLSNYDFLIPTKRPERIQKCLPANWHDGYHNVWLGVSVENQQTADERIPILAKMPAALKWISVEPMLEGISLIYRDENWHTVFDWVVLGGESGPNYRSCDIGWLRDAVDQCRKADIPVFVKQLGGWPDTGHELTDFPEDLRIREFPR